MTFYDEHGGRCLSTSCWINDRASCRRCAAAARASFSLRPLQLYLLFSRGASVPAAVVGVPPQDDQEVVEPLLDLVHLGAKEGRQHDLQPLLAASSSAVSAGIVERTVVGLSSASLRTNAAPLSGDVTILDDCPARATPPPAAVGTSRSSTSEGRTCEVCGCGRRPRGARTAAARGWCRNAPWRAPPPARRRTGARR